MLDTIQNILHDTNSYYYSYCRTSHTIQRKESIETAFCIRDLVNITQRLNEFKIDFTVTENNSIQLINKSSKNL